MRMMNFYDIPMIPSQCCVCNQLYEKRMIEGKNDGRDKGTILEKCGWIKKSDGVCI